MARAVIYEDAVLRRCQPEMPLDIAWTPAIEAELIAQGIRVTGAGALIRTIQIEPPFRIDRDEASRAWIVTQEPRP